jgi:hypothetical protein
LILVSVLLLELVTAVFLGFANFQTFMEKLEARNKTWPCQDSQQRADTGCEFNKETTAYMKGNLLFPNRDFIPDIMANKCNNERVLRRKRKKIYPFYWREAASNRELIAEI